VNAYGVKAGWVIPFVDKRVNGRKNCVIPPTHVLEVVYDDAQYKSTLHATHTFIHEWNEPSCLYSISIHQMAPPERLQLTTNLLTSKG